MRLILVVLWAQMPLLQEKEDCLPLVLPRQ
jgi:hypothetical protein